MNNINSQNFHIWNSSKCQRTVLYRYNMSVFTYVAVFIQYLYAGMSTHAAWYNKKPFTILSCLLTTKASQFVYIKPVHSHANIMERVLNPALVGVGHAASRVKLNRLIQIIEF